jgi:hypothetical protein
MPSSKCEDDVASETWSEQARELSMPAPTPTWITQHVWDNSVMWPSLETKQGGLSAGCSAVVEPATCG